MATYSEMFGAIPEMTVHLIRRMNEVGISPGQLSAALRSQAQPGTSPGTIMFIAEGTTAVVDEVTGDIITVW
jgi:hypothetical protein